MESIYYNTKTGYTGADNLKKQTKSSKFQVKKWLEKQQTYTLHKPCRKVFPRNKVLVSTIDEQWQMDLADLSAINEYNEGYKYLLNCIDIFSKYAWSIPVKTKSGESITNAFQSLLESTPRRPQKIQTDAGKEFLNKKFQDLLRHNDISFFTTNSEMKASVVERFNRTLKERMWRYFTHKNTYKYIDILQDLMSAYNNSKHRTIGMKPIEVNESNASQILKRAYQVSKEPVVFRFSIGEKVRVSKSKRTFEKGYVPNWSEEIFIIKQRLSRHPPVYMLHDQMNEPIEGIFYEPELQRVEHTDDVYIVEKVLKKRKRGGKMEYFVKWRGYPEKFNSWVNYFVKPSI